MTHLLAAILATSLYLLTTVLLLLRCREYAPVRHIAKPVLLSPALLALLAHAWVLQGEILSPTGINLGFYNMLSLVSAFIVLLTLVATLRYAVELLSMLVLPLAALSVVVDATADSSHLLAPGSSAGLIAHILTSLTAYSVLALAALHAILLSVQNRYLHNRQPGGFIKLLPPLKTMEALLFETITIGFALLSISLLTGLVFLENMFAQHLAHKTLLSLFAWVVFAILLGGRVLLGWRGKTAVRWTLGGFISLMLAYFGSKLVLEILLG